jgi:hypothetical protein
VGRQTFEAILSMSADDVDIDDQDPGFGLHIFARTMPRQADRAVAYEWRVPGALFRAVLALHARSIIVYYLH